MDSTSATHILPLLGTLYLAVNICDGLGPIVRCAGIDQPRIRECMASFLQTYWLIASEPIIDHCVLEPSLYCRFILYQRAVLANNSRGPQGLPALQLGGLGKKLNVLQAFPPIRLETFPCIWPPTATRNTTVLAIYVAA